MQKFIIGLALGVACGTVLMAYSRDARELASAGKDFASEKMQNMKNQVESKTEEIKKPKEEEKPKRPTAKKVTKPKTADPQKTESKKAE